jgi:hypothetical protein
MDNHKYWTGWPGKCPYNDDVNWACSIAIQWLQKIAPNYKKSGKTGLVVFDLDDTLFMGDPEHIIGMTEMSLGNQKPPRCADCVKNNRQECKGCSSQEVFILPPNKQVVKVANVARELGFKIVCLTARPKESQLASVANLNMFNIPHDMLIMNDKDEDPFFKVRVRQKLSAPANQDIVCTIGDQFTDIYLPGKNTCAIKLPDAESKCAYVYVP